MHITLANTNYWEDMCQVTFILMCSILLKQLYNINIQIGEEKNAYFLVYAGLKFVIIYTTDQHLPICSLVYLTQQRLRSIQD